MIKQTLEEATAGFEVWQDNWPAFSFFESLNTQFRWGVMGGCLGLDYPAVEAAMRMRRIKNRPEMFEAVQAMERAALDVWNREK